MTNNNKMFKVEYIKSVMDTKIKFSVFVESVSISGACTKVARNEDCVCVLSVTMYTGCFDVDKKVETVEDYEEATK